MLVARALQSIVKVGSLELADAKGRTHRIEGGPGPSVAASLHDPRLHWKLLTNPFLHVGEAYMNGTLKIDRGTLGDLIELCCANLSTIGDNPLFKYRDWLGLKLRSLQQYNPVGRAKANVAHHYDLSATLYDLFLDKDRQYSCAYFTDPGESLDTAQENKKRHLAAKLLIRPETRVLDIGSGWGGLGLYLARTCEATVTGVTLSEEQHTLSNRHAAEAGLSHRARFHLRDYREETGVYDRIVSVGMFEHVGAGHYREFFAKMRTLLADDGVAVLHSIGRMEPPSNTNAWLRKYIFPGGYSPALSEVLAAIERERLFVTDIEILRLHYAETLRHWYDRFQANRARIAEIYDERFCRMWEFYLKGCEMAFRYWNQMVFQIQIAKRQDAVPLTRDYMLDWERAHRATSATDAPDATTRPRTDIAA
ncbi:MAG: class I SAM-dependent methyltransferase [Alphaproteobacteria bacterium]|nr:class I SAM-dependent methyltransferase [Alphaproteobacteria bacterium]